MARRTSRPPAAPKLPEFRHPKSLADAAVKIQYLGNSLHEHAYLLGMHLRWAKKKVGHGGWAQWFKDRFWFGERKAQMVMRYSKECEKAGRMLPYHPGKSETLAESDEWYSPVEVIEAARKVMGGIDLDPASCAKANERVKAAKYYSPEKRQDGLKLPWRGRLWLNPPYCSQTQEFIEKLLDEEASCNVTEAVVLLNTYHISLPWFDDFWFGRPLCFPIRPLKFLCPDGKEHGMQAGAVIVYVAKNEAGRERFEEVFSTAGAGGNPIGHLVRGLTAVVDLSKLSAAHREEIQKGIDASGLSPSEFLDSAIDHALAARKAKK